MEVIRRTAAVCVALAAAGALAACGQTGPLYLPGEAHDIVTRPAQPVPADSGNAPDSPRTPDAPAEPPSPAPEATAPPADEDKDEPAGQKPGPPPPR